MGSDLQRSCARGTCPLDARPKGKLCRDHHAAAMREWRKLRESACRRRDGVVAARIDPSDTRAITWACRGCRYDLVSGLRQRREDEAVEATLTRERLAAEQC